jgi:hypothetical protein
MSELVTRYALSSRPPTGAAVLRSRTVVWREQQALIVVDASGVRTIPHDWDLYSHEVTPDGRFVSALGDDGKRAAVSETRTGRRLLDLVGEKERRQSLRASLASIGNELLVFVAHRNKDISILAVHDGTERGWISTTGMIWFHVLRIVPLDGRWLAVHGYHDGEGRDTIVAIPAIQALQDPMFLYGALTERPSVKEWGYRIAVGPAGPGRAVFFRDPQWGDDEPVDDPAESFHGLVVWDLESKRVVQRISYRGKVEDGATLGADGERVAIEAGGHIDVVARSTGEVRQIEADALDPYRLEVVRAQGETITVAKL